MDPMTDARYLARALILVSALCLLALALWPALPAVSRADLVRERMGIER